MKAMILCPLTQKELNHCINCYVKLESAGTRTLRNTIKRRRKHFQLLTAVWSNKSVKDIQLEEVAINNKIARVELERLQNIDDYVTQLYERSSKTGNEDETEYYTTLSSRKLNTVMMNGQSKLKNKRNKHVPVVSKRKKIFNRKFSDFLVPREIIKIRPTQTTLTRNEKPIQEKKEKPKENSAKSYVNSAKHKKPAKVTAIKPKISPLKDIQSKSNNRMVKINPSNVRVIESVHYVLVLPQNSMRMKIGQCKTTIEFQRLLRMIQQVTLPSTEWKIKIVLRQQMVARIAFSNKGKCERCVHFYRNKYNYDITFGKEKVILLGAPQIVSSLHHLSILLDIVHHIADNDPVLEYCNKQS